MPPKSGQPQPQIDLTQLPLPQLQNVRSQMLEEIETLTSAFASLRAAQSKFTGCLESLDSVDNASAGKTILIPLTNSYLYVPGKFKSMKKVIVDVGTGYMVSKPVNEAKDFYKRKIEFVKGNSEKLSKQITERRDQLNVLEQVMVQKQKMMMAQQQQAVQV